MALLASLSALALRPAAEESAWLLGQILQVVGGLLLVGASLSVKRSFGIFPANRGIQTGGIYRFVRHPFYATYWVITLGYFLSNQRLLNLGVLVVSLVFQVIRIRFEERLLSKDEDYVAYQEKVRWRLLPGVW